MFFRSLVVTACLCCAFPALALSPEPFAKLNEIRGVKVSPKGDRLAITMRANGRSLLNIVSLPDLKPIGSFGIQNDRDIEDVYWSSNDRLLFGLSHRLGKEEASVLTGDLMAVNVDGSDVATLLGMERRNTLLIEAYYRNWDLVDLLDDDDENILVSIYEDSALPYLYRLNTKKGKKTRLMQSRYRYADFVTDHDGKVRFQGGSERDGEYVLLYRDSEGGSWSEIGRYSTLGDGDGGFGPVAFAADNKRIYFTDARGADTYGLYLVDPAKVGEPQLLFRDEIYDFGGLLPSLTPGVPIGVQWYGERTQWKYFEPHHPDVPIFESIRKAFGATHDVTIVNSSRDRSIVTVFARSDVDPGAYYVIDIGKGAMLARLPVRPWVKPEEMSPKQPITVKARDGLDLRGYLTQPRQAATGAKKKMVVMVHGGPIGVRDTWSYDDEVQWLAANGFTVLQINFRGSGGYGATFAGRGFGEWGGKMQDDVTDATLWAIEKGYADKSSICIYGASYGAYSAMMGLIREPDLYRCGVGYVGVYDLELLKRDGLASDSPEGRAYLRAVLGKTGEELRKISPATRGADIKAPVFLVHAGEDRRAPTAQYERMRDALQKNGRKVETLFKKKEDHGFISEANVAEFYTRLVQFMDASLATE